MQSISPTNTKRFALFELGFRPFFLLASLFSIISIAIWTALFTFGWTLNNDMVTPIAWHGHEMLFAYTGAVVAGFLLTAVRNWTGNNTITGLPLLLLALVWLLARILPLTSSALLFDWAMLFDLSFFIGLIIAVARPILKAKQWRQLPIIFILVLLLSANITYYLGVFHIVTQGVSWGLFSAVYLFITIIFIISNRVLPFFIERGIDDKVTLKHYPFIDSVGLPILASLFLLDVFFNQPLLVAILSSILALLHSVRLAGWYNKGIWQKPLLWVLFLGYSLFILGFILKLLNFFQLYPSSIPLHAFTYGGIGMMTLGMISRVSLGHTGRNINKLATSMSWAFIFLFIGTLVRVILPIFIPSAYLHIIGLAQLLWILAFMIFVYNYFTILMSPRPDGQPG